MPPHCSSTTRALVEGRDALVERGLRADQRFARSSRLGKARHASRSLDTARVRVDGVVTFFSWGRSRKDATTRGRFFVRAPETRPGERRVPTRGAKTEDAVATLPMRLCFCSVTRVKEGRRSGGGREWPVRFVDSAFSEGTFLFFSRDSTLELAFCLAPILPRPSMSAPPFPFGVRALGRPQATPRCRTRRPPRTF